MSLVGHNATMTQLYEILVESVCQNLKLTNESLKKQLDAEDAKLSLPEPLHFKPFNFGHLLTLVYPVGLSVIDSCRVKFIKFFFGNLIF